MDAGTLAEMAGDVLVAALRSKRGDEAFGQVGAVFERWQCKPPVELYLRTSASAASLSPAGQRELAGRWQRACAELLAARPQAEPDLRALIEGLRRFIPPESSPAAGAPLTPPVGRPSGVKPQDETVPKQLGVPAAPPPNSSATVVRPVPAKPPAAPAPPPAAAPASEPPMETTQAFAPDPGPARAAPAPVPPAEQTQIGPSRPTPAAPAPAPPVRAAPPPAAPAPAPPVRAAPPPAAPAPAPPVRAAPPPAAPGRAAPPPAAPCQAAPGSPAYGPPSYAAPFPAGPAGPGAPGPPRGRGGKPRGGKARQRPPASPRGRRNDRPGEPPALVAPWGQDPVSRAIRSAVRPGVLAFNPPAEMTQGRADRVEVGIGRSADLLDELTSGLRGRGEIRVEHVPTSAFMSAELRGASFVIVPLSPAEQIVAPTARWEFDVTPRHSGVQTLTLCINMRFAETGPLAVAGSRIAVPVVERQIRIRVNVGYGARAFIGQNWQWLVGTAVAIGGAIAAFLTVFH